MVGLGPLHAEQRAQAADAVGDLTGKLRGDVRAGVRVLQSEMGAVDVAFTEAAVGAGVSTVIMIATVTATLVRLFSPSSTEALVVSPTDEPMITASISSRFG